METINLLIAGRDVPAAGSATFNRLNPISGEVATRAASRDIAKAIELAKRIESGICDINGPTVHDEAQMPFGGVKASGYGRFGGKAGINEFTDLRWITIQTTPRHYPF